VALYGDMSLADQRRAIKPAGDGRRKVVLATNIAESSLTIDGVSIVIDTGLSREPAFDSRTGMTRLQTLRISRASSVQRAGRAGRLGPGQCIRLWSKLQQDQLKPHSTPEILQADLAPLVLQLACWGVYDPDELRWLDSPPQAPFEHARTLLASLGALEKNGAGGYTVTPHGQEIASIPAHPRIAHMLVTGAKYGLARLASRMAALLVERDPLHGAGPDLGLRLALLDSDQTTVRRPKGTVQHLRALEKQFAGLVQRAAADDSRLKDRIEEPAHPRWQGFLLALAYPDRVGQRRGENSQDYLLSSGRMARLPASDTLQQSPWLVAAQLGGERGSRYDQIYLATSLDEQLFSGLLSDLVVSRDHAEWDDKLGRFVAESRQSIGQLVISRKQLESVPPEQKRAALLDLLRRKGLELLPWTEALRQWQARVNLLRALDIETGSESESRWPDVSDERLLATLEHWLAPYLDNVRQLQHFKALDLPSILHALLPWPLPRELDEWAPERIDVPSGSRIRIDYTRDPPVLAVRLQEMFGAAATPRVARGRKKLMLHLLSPAQRPLAVTQDLESFWEQAYPDVKKDMKGRYPKHHWPDSPLDAEATSRAKPRKSTPSR